MLFKLLAGHHALEDLLRVWERTERNVSGTAGSCVVRPRGAERRENRILHCVSGLVFKIILSRGEGLYVVGPVGHPVHVFVANVQEGWVLERPPELVEKLVR